MIQLGKTFSHLIDFEGLSQNYDYELPSLLERLDNMQRKLNKHVFAM